MRRREFIALLSSGLVGWPFDGYAQQRGKLSRVGFLRIGAPPPSFISPLRKALKDRGYVEGKNFVFDFQLAKHVSELPGLAAKLVRDKVDVIVASGTPAVLPARNATTTVPVVFIAAIDPVATGVVTSLARPGGHVTGLTAVFSDLIGKRLQLLKEMLPSLTRVALLSRPANPGHQQYVLQGQMAARILHIELEVAAVTSADEFEAVFRRIQDVGALIQIDDAMFTSHRRKLVELATRYRIPGAYGFRAFIKAGGFVALGPSYSDLYRRAAAFIDKILKGAKPDDLPVEQPSKFEFILNLKTAKALGLTIASAIVARADDVIE
jgi:putative ABC transport system substrate-binding protein